MKSFFKKTLWLFLAVAAAYGGYYGYTRVWQDRPVRAQIKENIFGVVDVISKTAKKASEEIGEETKKKKQALVESAEESAENYVRERAAEKVLELGGKIQSFAGTIAGNKTLSGAGSNAGSSGAPPAALVFQENMPLVISIQGSTYSVDWGDGAEEKNVPVGGEKVISHRWLNEGDYLVRLEVKENGATYLSSFLVRITNEGND